MDALIKATKVSNLQKEKNNSNMELVNLLKRKIEEFITEDKKIVIDVSSPLIICRNTFSTEDYEINNEYLYLNQGNFELHIKLDKVKIEYDNTVDENFILVYNDTEIMI